MAFAHSQIRLPARRVPEKYGILPISYSAIFGQHPRCSDHTPSFAGLRSNHKALMSQLPDDIEAQFSLCDDFLPQSRWPATSAFNSSDAWFAAPQTIASRPPRRETKSATTAKSIISSRINAQRLVRLRIKEYYCLPKRKPIVIASLSSLASPVKLLT